MLMSRGNPSIFIERPISAGDVGVGARSFYSDDSPPAPFAATAKSPLQGEA